MNNGSTSAVGGRRKESPACTLSLDALFAVLLADSCLHNATQSMYLAPSMRTLDF